MKRFSARITPVVRKEKITKTVTKSKTSPNDRGNPAQEKSLENSAASASPNPNNYNGYQYMTTTNAERLRAYKAKMKKAGFKRLSVYVHPDLVIFLDGEREPSECGGRALERLLLGQARKRPPLR